MLLLSCVAWNASAKLVKSFCFYTSGTNSFYEDEYVRISIEGEHLYILNKSDKVLFLDKGTSFYMLNGTTNSFYTNAVYSNTSSQGQGASVDLGRIGGKALNGVTVGGSTSSVNSKTVIEQRIVSLAPHTKYTLYTWDQRINWIRRHLKNEGTLLPREAGRYFNFSSENSPLKQGAYITYAFKEDFSDAQSRSVEDYVYYIRYEDKKATIETLGENDLSNKYRIVYYEGGLQPGYPVPEE